MTKSELIESLGRRQSQLAYKDVELAVKTVLEHMANTLSNGERIEIRGFGSFSCIIVRLALAVIRNPVNLYLYRQSMFRILNRVSNCASVLTVRIMQLWKLHQTLLTKSRLSHQLAVSPVSRMEATSMYGFLFTLSAGN